MITLFATFLILLIIGPLFITGWYVITRGHYAIEPDGSFVAHGKILKHWSLFWEDIDKYKEVYYYGHQLELKYDAIVRMLPKYKARLTMNEGNCSLLCPAPLSEDEEHEIQKAILCSLFVKDNDIFIYTEKPVYRFPEWVRMPVSSCLPCMSSVYGSFFWLVAYFVSVFLFKFDVSTAGWIVLWPFYVVSVSGINYFIDKKI